MGRPKVTSKTISNALSGGLLSVPVPIAINRIYILKTARTNDLLTAEITDAHEDAKMIAASYGILKTYLSIAYQNCNEHPIKENLERFERAANQIAEAMLDDILDPSRLGYADCKDRQSFVASTTKSLEGFKIAATAHKKEPSLSVPSTGSDITIPTHIHIFDDVASQATRSGRANKKGQDPETLAF